MIAKPEFVEEKKWGWNEFFEAHYEEASRGLKEPVLVRIISESHGIYSLYIPSLAKAARARIRGRIHYNVDNRENMPAVGDWALIDTALGTDGELRIEALLPRQTELKRKAPGERGYNQVFAANLSEVWIVTSLNHDFSENRLDRILALVAEGGAHPRILLTKADLLKPEEQLRYEQIMKARFPEQDWYFVKAFDEGSVGQLKSMLMPSQTYILVGSSGVGKSTLINRILGRDKQLTKEVRSEDSKGRHTTTHRELIMLSEGALMVDTPGVREWQLLDSEDSIQQYQDVEELFVKCRFTDCRHMNEPHCAVKKALQDETLSQDRWQSYLRLKQDENRVTKGLRKAKNK